MVIFILDGGWSGMKMKCENSSFKQTGGGYQLNERNICRTILYFFKDQLWGRACCLRQKEKKMHVHFIKVATDKK